MKKHIAYLGAVLCAANLLCACSGDGTIDTVDLAAPAVFDYCFVDSPVQVEGYQPAVLPEGYEKKAENGYLQLYVHPETTAIALEDMRTGRVWSTIPLDLDNDEQTTAERKDLIRSTLKIEYYAAGKSTMMYSYTDCVQNENFEITAIENGVRVLYRVGKNEVTFDDLPKKLSDERFRMFFVDNNNLTETDKKRVNRYFKYNEEEHVWEMISTTTTTLRELPGIMQRVGYTAEELAKDNEENGIPVTAGGRIFFDVPVDYMLQNDSLIVDIPLEEVDYAEEYPPVQFMLNEMFLSERESTEGYIFVPDGCGALINFSQNEKDIGQYTLQLYGTDLPMSNQFMILQTRVPSSMPVYGISSGKSGMLAIIEDGDAMSLLHANKAGSVSAYNNVYTSFVLRPTAQAAIGGGTGMVQQFPVFQTTMYTGHLRTRFVALAGDTTYSQMAACYKRYLMIRDGLDAKGIDPNESIQLQLIGSVSKWDSFLGFNYESSQKLTDFSQAREILEKFENEGVAVSHVRFIGAMKGGIDNHAVSNPKILSDLGGAKGYQELNEYVKGRGGSLYLGANLLTVPENSGNYSKFNCSSRTLDQALSKNFSYSFDNTVWSWSAIVSPRYLPDYTTKFIDGINKAGADAVAFGDLGSTFFSDFNKSKVVTRQESKRITENILKSVKEEGHILLTTPMIDNIRYADTVVGIPLYSNQDRITSRSVPFLQMVLSGLVPYSGDAYNGTEDTVWLRLKMAETGAIPYFSLFYEDNTVLRYTGFNNMSTNNYTLWFDEAVSLYKEFKELRAVLEGACIARHEEVGNNVYKTSYDNGYTVYVNYSDDRVMTQGVTIDACDYVLVKEVG